MTHIGVERTTDGALAERDQVVPASYRGLAAGGDFFNLAMPTKGTERAFAKAPETSVR